MMIPPYILELLPHQIVKAYDDFKAAYELWQKGGWDDLFFVDDELESSDGEDEPSRGVESTDKVGDQAPQDGNAPAPKKIRKRKMRPLSPAQLKKLEAWLATLPPVDETPLIKLKRNSPMKPVTFNNPYSMNQRKLDDLYKMMVRRHRYWHDDDSSPKWELLDDYRDGPLLDYLWEVFELTKETFFATPIIDPKNPPYLESTIKEAWEEETTWEFIGQVLTPVMYFVFLGYFTIVIRYFSNLGHLVYMKEPHEPLDLSLIVTWSLILIGIIAFQNVFVGLIPEWIRRTRAQEKRELADKEFRRQRIEAGLPAETPYETQRRLEAERYAAKRAEKWWFEPDTDQEEDEDDEYLVQPVQNVAQEEEEDYEHDEEADPCFCGACIREARARIAAENGEGDDFAPQDIDDEPVVGNDDVVVGNNDPPADVNAQAGVGMIQADADIQANVAMIPLHDVVLAHVDINQADAAASVQGEAPTGQEDDIAIIQEDDDVNTIQQDDVDSESN